MLGLFPLRSRRQPVSTASDRGAAGSSTPVAVVLRSGTSWRSHVSTNENPAIAVATTNTGWSDAENAVMYFSCTWGGNRLTIAGVGDPGT
jgi:hypothetical protein